MTYKLEDLGNRIVILGRSSLGKSTLAKLLSEKLKCDVVHMDKLAHIEGSNWVRKSEEVISKLHDDVIRQDAWVIEGNYTALLPKRLDRSTSVIWLEMPIINFLYSYLKRSWMHKHKRIGAIGARNDFSFSLIYYALFKYPKKKKIILSF